jgi:hypothetical protein
VIDRFERRHNTAAGLHDELYVYGLFFFSTHAGWLIGVSRCGATKQDAQRADEDSGRSHCILSRSQG